MKTLFILTIIHILCAGSSTMPLKLGSKQQVQAVITKENADTTSLTGQWYLQPILPSDTAAGKIPVIMIDLAAAKFSGNTGCNAMRGSFQKTDTSLVFNQDMVTTKMLCTGYNEAAFIKNLLRTNKYKIENGVLILLFDATELSRWTRKPVMKKVFST